MFIETPHLIVRKFEETDFDDFCAYAMDPEMCRMMGRDLLETVEDARLNFIWLMDKEERGYCLVHKETGNLTVAQVPAALTKLPALDGKQGRSLSFSISRHYQRQGLMLEAVQAVIQRLFDKEDMDYVQFGYFDFNIASKGLQEKLGFTHLATITENVKGESVSIVENVLWRL